MQVRESDQVCLVICWYRENGMPDLLDVDSARERCLLRIVSLQVDAMVFIMDVVRCDGRMVTVEKLLVVISCQWTGKYKPDLLRNKLRRTSLILPFPKEQLSQEGIQRFLLIPKLLTPTRILLFQRTEKPFQHQ